MLAGNHGIGQSWDRAVRQSGYYENAMTWKERIVLDPEILAGKPVVKGTRLSVEFIVGLLAEGWSHEELIRNYPHLTADDI